MRSPRNEAGLMIGGITQRTVGTYKSFRQFLLGGNFLSTAIGVVIGASFSSFIKEFIAFFYGLVDFTRLALAPEHKLDASLIPWSSFSQSFFTLMLMAVALFFIIQFINGLIASKPQEKFGYDYYLDEMQHIKTEQKRTNQLLSQILKEKQKADD
ncbi:MscL family protein [Eupransor demetentiae]|uniref:Large-conductance mechanosensitive channel (MscL) n=1 Tax=Eupransor demetentiae TaxID=3109584 RepID=A0ABM9N388_9LACO|nr:Large-conductance mechanosensitive channel (MscL) [Lactobacillaceae bacterium LMG 33000]